MNVNANRRRIRCRSDFWSPRIAWMKSNHTELRLYGNRDLWVELASPKLTSCFITALHFHRINVESYANCSRYDTSRTTFLDEGNLWIKKFLEKRKIVRARDRIVTCDLLSTWKLKGSKKGWWNRFSWISVAVVAKQTRIFPSITNEDISREASSQYYG